MTFGFLCREGGQLLFDSMNCHDEIYLKTQKICVQNLRLVSNTADNITTSVFQGTNLMKLNIVKEFGVNCGKATELSGKSVS